MQRWMAAGILLMLSVTQVNAQRDGYKERVQKYIEKHKMLAMAEQQRTGVPAAITLGQGVLETEAGESELATQANNHFGIKCKSTWKGETFAHTDDAPNECFRKYGNTYESYKDHSDFLKQPRYNPLFKLSMSDYEGWAKGLKKFGYATNPRYAQQLIKVIEDFGLQDYTFAASNKDIIYPTEIVPTEDAPAKGVAVKETKPTTVAVNKATISNNKATSNNKTQNNAKTKPGTVNSEVAITTTAAPEKMHTIQEVVQAKEIVEAKGDAGTTAPDKIFRINGLRAVEGSRGDVLLTYAIKHNIRYERLLEINELPDAPIMSNMYIFLDKKKTRGARATRQVGDNETIAQIAQAEGMQQKSLRELNNLEADEEPQPGEILQLQRAATKKPQLIAKSTSLPPEPEKKGQKAARKSTYLDKKEIEKAKNEPQLAVATAPAPKPVAIAKTESVKAAVKTEQPAIAPKEEDEQPRKFVIKTRAERMREAEEAKKAEALAVTPNKNDAEIEKTRLIKPFKPKSEISRESKESTVAEKNEAVKEPVIAKQESTIEKRETPVTEAPVNIPVQNEQVQEGIPDPVKEETVAVKETPKVEEPVKKEQETVKEVAIAEPERKPQPVVEQPKRPLVTNEPQDEFSRLKAQLDKVVYASDSRDAEMKAAEAARQEKKVVSQSVAQKELTANVKEEAGYYIVKKGDTAFSIAKKNKLTMRQLMEWNNMDWAEVQIGQRLKVKP